MLQVGRRSFQCVQGIEEYYHQSSFQIFDLLGMGTKETAFTVYIELGSFGSKFARYVESMRNLLEDVFVSENGIGFKLISVGLRLALLCSRSQTVISIAFRYSKLTTDLFPFPKGAMEAYLQSSSAFSSTSGNPNSVIGLRST
jgi:hypothetical protein